jgi:hypothetical protein
VKSTDESITYVGSMRLFPFDLENSKNSVVTMEQVVWVP